MIFRGTFYIITPYSLYYQYKVVPCLYNGLHYNGIKYQYKLYAYDMKYQNKLYAYDMKYQDKLYAHDMKYQYKMLSAWLHYSFDINYRQHSENIHLNQLIKIVIKIIIM